MPPRGYPAGPPSAHERISYYDSEFEKSVGRTKTGTLLLAIGIALSWVPYPLLGAAAGIITVIGGVLVILGRKAFGDRHARFVGVSVAMIVLTLISGFVLAAIFANQLVVAFRGEDVAGVQNAFRLILYGGTALAALVGVAYVLFVHELANRVGKYLLYAGYAVSLVVAVVVLTLSTNLLATLGPGMTPQDIATIAAAVETYQLLEAVPSGVFAAAYVAAYSRVSRVEVPKRVRPATGAPATPWPGAHVPPPPPATATVAPPLPNRPGPPPEL